MIAKVPSVRALCVYSAKITCTIQVLGMAGARPRRISRLLKLLKARGSASRNWVYLTPASGDTMNSIVLYAVRAGRTLETAVSSMHGRLLSTQVTGLNINKTGSDPEMMRDEDVPDWLRKLGQSGAGLSLQELERRKADELSDEDRRSLKRKRNRQAIKRANSLTAK